MKTELEDAPGWLSVVTPDLARKVWTEMNSELLERALGELVAGFNSAGYDLAAGAKGECGISYKDYEKIRRLVVEAMGRGMGIHRYEEYAQEQIENGCARGFVGSMVRALERVGYGFVPIKRQ